MRVLVCGSRTWSDEAIVHAILDGLFANAAKDDFALIEGGAKGADAVAADWAKMHRRDIEHLDFPADWATHGRAAGPKRNQRMIDEGRPDLVAAFTDKPLADSKGTADMVRRARAAGIPIYHVTSIT